MNTSKKSLVIGGVLCAASAAIPVAAAQASATSSVSVGDKCLVGTFRASSAHVTFTIDKTAVHLTGGNGAVEKISASGTDHVDFTGSKAFTGKYKGHTLSVKFSGSGHSTIHANSANTKITSGRLTSTNGIRTVATYDGNKVASTLKHQAGGTDLYTCTSKHLVETNKSGSEKTIEVRITSKT